VLCGSGKWLACRVGWPLSTLSLLVARCIVCRKRSILYYLNYSVARTQPRCLNGESMMTSRARYSKPRSTPQCRTVLPSGVFNGIIPQRVVCLFCTTIACFLVVRKQKKLSYRRETARCFVTFAKLFNLTQSAFLLQVSFNPRL